jgi:hypothetical protein
MDQVVDIIGAMYHPASLTTYNGELKQGIRSVFLLADGKILSSFSDAIKRFIDQDLVPVFTKNLLQKGDCLLVELMGTVSVQLDRQPTKKGGATYAPHVV